MSRQPRRAERRPTYLDQLNWKARKDLENELHGEDIWREVACSYHLDAKEVRNMEVQASNQSVSASALLFQRLLFLDVNISDLCCRLIDLGYLPAARVLYPHASELAQGKFKAKENEHNPPGSPLSSDEHRLPLDVVPADESACSESSAEWRVPFSETERVHSWVRSLGPAEAEGDELQMSSRVKSIQQVLQFFSFKRILQTTNNFGREHLLGEGSYSSVYKADIDGTLYAVKVFDLRKQRVESALVRQLFDQSLCVFSYRHKHIVSLRGYSLGNSDCLLYEFLENGSLRGALDSESLDSQQRLRILDQIASALSFLHSRETPVTHGELNSSHILLDRHMDAKITGLELSQWVASNVITYSDSILMRSKESLYCLPTECLRTEDPPHDWVFTTTTDIFSFGVIVLEILTGLRAYDESRGENSSFITYYIFNEPAAESFSRRADPSARWTQLTYLSLLTLAAECLNEADPQQRPCVGKVVQLLNQIQRQSPHTH